MRLVASPRRKLLLLVTACASACVGSTASAADARYLYVLSCSAQLQKLDTTTGRKITSTDLARRSRLVPTHGDAANSVPDGCSTYGAAYSDAKQLLYTVAPVTGSMHGTPRHYRVLTFQLPGLHAGPAIDLQEAFAEDDPPALESDAGTITLRADGRTWRLIGSHFVADPAGTPELPDSRPPGQTDSFRSLDLSRYRVSDKSLGPSRDAVAYTPLERAGDVVLVQFISPGKGIFYATVDAHDKTFTPLNIPFKTTEDRVHLAPGGKLVVVQEASHGAVAGLSITTARIAALDVASGAVTKAWTEASVAGWFLLTVTPKALLVFYRGEETRLVPAAIEPSAGKVAALHNAAGPAFFYADR